MLDTRLLPIIKKPLNLIAKVLDTFGVSANYVTIAGFLIGACAIPLLWQQHYVWALIAILLNRICDGIDGELARITEPTDLGGYLDITLDFIFYSGVVFGFALAQPEINGLASAFLIFSFMGTGASFLAFAIMAEKRHIETLEYGRKSLYFIGGLTEGTETIACFVLMCLFPDYFIQIAVAFGLMCWLTTVTRIYAAYRTLK
ncbi:CDP-alcohol phosphatidyltransferase family protein [Marinomonas mediterranea]|uniref:CDP-alcohol phosphatidyltransferase n=1 Tax=Marinomonas mediterranea (strain ATCC 700492 / JCM 21426 / NBRC 103028 / MMB-1) TaxID=717774 RepID=F2K2F2_MARM1|nr:CDP-alcohol phosphatidyltransferase family protein [Marinomonas mediterranea]ADZ92332.1 CDP-alcohol phosphatidyltransferase [Marinomonas mediterranea MMB-1]WCN10284.1 CDP-alcohol phosphatidyltransferase family protein [Marinomonas mediterranea]WCN14330.1 CDP-alcohol phosphatidyltransferase family protein [Marinomonas mediterranea]WCN18382.1 CDP-alcohol phosphatidyltransferase family protein [Marinomonas mediterranea MMB-1]